MPCLAQRTHCGGHNSCRWRQRASGGKCGPAGTYQCSQAPIEASVSDVREKAANASGKTSRAGLFTVLVNANVGYFAATSCAEFTKIREKHRTMF